MSEFLHGRDCQKVEHIGSGDYLHCADDDYGYDVDGLMYCGRCHQWLPDDVMTHYDASYKDYNEALALLPDSLHRPLSFRVRLLIERANSEARLAVALRVKLHEIAGAEIASAVIDPGADKP